MLLPAIQYGDWKTVKRRMRKVVTQLKRGADLVELMTHEGMLDLAEHPGMLLMGGINPGRVPHFHCYVPWRPAWHALFDERTSTPTTPTPKEDEIFAASLRAPWGLLGILAWDNQAWLSPRERHQPFLHAVLAAWDELDAVGRRYFESVQSERLWSLTTGLHYVLANMGVPDHVLQAPLPAEGPRALLRYARAQS
jgi:hypothetical protein